jgi:hypothetical protein
MGTDPRTPLSNDHWLGGQFKSHRIKVGRVCGQVGTVSESMTEKRFQKPIKGCKEGPTFPFGDGTCDSIVGGTQLPERLSEDDGAAALGIDDHGT